MRGFHTSSFDPQTLVVLETAFDEAWLTLKAIGNSTVRPDELARSVLRLAMEGERVRCVCMTARSKACSPPRPGGRRIRVACAGQPRKRFRRHQNYICGSGKLPIALSEDDQQNNTIACHCKRWCLFARLGGSKNAKSAWRPRRPRPQRGCRSMRP